MSLEKVVRRGVGLVLALATAFVVATSGAAATAQVNPYSQLLRKADRQDGVKVIVELSSLEEQGPCSAGHALPARTSTSATDSSRSLLLRSTERHS